MVIKIIIGISIFVCALLIVCLIRAAISKNKPSDAVPAISHTSEEAAAYAQTLSHMVQVPTVSLRGQDDLTQFDKLTEVLKMEFPLIFSELEVTEIKGNLLFRWPGKDPDKNGILLMGHRDVVTADENTWTHNPFSGAVEDGLVHGRGAMDCKCTVMAEMQAVEELLNEGFTPERDIYLASSVNEEISGGGAKLTVAYLKEKGVRLDAVMDEGGAITTGLLPGLKDWVAAVGVIEKGYVDVKIKAKGAGGHSSTPPRNTPIARLSAFVAEMEKKHPFKCELSPSARAMFEGINPVLSFGFRFILSNLWLFKGLLVKIMPKVSAQGEAFLATTFAFTMSGGSKTPNVIPEEAYVVCNLRPSQHQNMEQSLSVLKKYADKHDLELEVIFGRDASHCTDHNGEEFKYLKKCVSECYPDAICVPYLQTGGTDCREYEAVSDNCLRFAPIKMTPEQISAMHAANESIGVEALADSVKFYKYYLRNHG